jgi:hypothetical protein
VQCLLAIELPVQVAQLCTLPELNRSEFDHSLDVELGPLGSQPTERVGPALPPGGIELYEKALSEFLEGLFGSAATLLGGARVPGRVPGPVPVLRLSGHYDLPVAPIK